MLNTVQIFVNFVTTLFQPYKAEIEEEGSKLTCDSLKQAKSKDFSPNKFLSSKIVIQCERLLESCRKCIHTGASIFDPIMPNS